MERSPELPPRRVVESQDYSTRRHTMPAAPGASVDDDKEDGSPRKKPRVSFAQKYSVKTFVPNKHKENEATSPSLSSEEQEQELSPTTASPPTVLRHGDSEGHSAEFPSLNQMIHNGVPNGRDSIASNTSEIQMQQDITYSFKHGFQTEDSTLQAADVDEERVPQATPAPREDPSAKLRGATRSGTPPRLASHDLNTLRGVTQETEEDLDEEDAAPMQLDGLPSPGIGLTSNQRPGNQAHLGRRLFDDSPGNASARSRTSSAMGDVTGQVNLSALAENDENEGSTSIPDFPSLNPVTPKRKTSMRSQSASVASTNQDMLREFKRNKYAMSQEERLAAGYDTDSQAPGTPQDDSIEFENGDGWASATPNSERCLPSPSPTVDLSSISSALDAQNSQHRRRVEEVLEEEEEGEGTALRKHHPEVRRSFPKKLDAHQGRTSTGSNESESALVDWENHQNNTGSTVRIDIVDAPVKDSNTIPLKDAQPRSSANRPANTPVRSAARGIPDDSPSPGTHMSVTQMSMDFVQMNRDFEEQMEENGHSPLGEDIDFGLGSAFDKPNRQQPGKIAAFTAPAPDPRAGLAAILRAPKPGKQRGQEKSPEQEGVVTPHYGSSPARFNVPDERSFDEDDCLEAKSEFQLIAPPKSRAGRQEPAKPGDVRRDVVGTRQPKRPSTIAELSRSPGGISSTAAGMSMPEFLNHCGIDLDTNVRMQVQRRSEMPREQDASQLDGLLAANGPGADVVRNANAENQKVRNQIFERSCSEVVTAIEGFGKEKETYVQRWDRRPTSPALVNALLKAKNSTSKSAMSSFQSRMAEFHRHCKLEASKQWTEVKHRRYQTQLTAMKEHTNKLRQALQHAREGGSLAEDIMVRCQNIRDKYQAEADTVRKGMQLQEQRKKFSQGEVESRNVLSACHEQLQFEKDQQMKGQQCKKENEHQMQMLYDQLKEMREGMEARQRTETQLRLALGFRTMRPVQRRHDEDVLRFRRGHHIIVTHFEGNVRLQLKPSEAFNAPSFRAPKDLMLELLERAWSQTVALATNEKSSAHSQWIAHVPRTKVSVILRRMDLFVVRLAALQGELESLRKNCPEILTIDCHNKHEGSPLQLRVSLMSSASHVVQDGVLRAISGVNNFQAEKIEIVFGGDLLSYPDIDWTDASVQIVFGNIGSQQVKQALALQHSGASCKNLSEALMSAAQVLTVTS